MNFALHIRDTLCSLWPEDKPIAWAIFFAFAFYFAYAAFQLIAPLVAFSGDKVSLLYLPAFVRVLAVLIAGLSGALGIFLGHLMVYAVYKSDPVFFAVAASAINALAPLMALIATRFLFSSRQILDLGWKPILVLSLLAAIFAGCFKAVFWGLTHLGELASFYHALANMAGNFLGIGCGFFLWLLLKRILPFEVRLRR
jgi:hypothetical protein